MKNELKEHGNIQSSLEYFLKFNLPKNVRILDIGCNYGSLIYNLHKLGYKNVQGIDINKEAIKEGKANYKSIKNKLKFYNGETIPFKEESFDVVLMFDVIEHIPNVGRFLKEEVYRVLKKKGLFIFQTPNKPMNILWVYMDNMSFKVKWWKEHCSLQTYSSLKKLLECSNFMKIKIEKHNILTQHNEDKVKKRMGNLGLLLLNLTSIMPLRLQSNFWGSAKK